MVANPNERLQYVKEPPCQVTSCDSSICCRFQCATWHKAKNKEDTQKLIREWERFVAVGSVSCKVLLGVSDNRGLRKLRNYCINKTKVVG
eukprot:scaffold2077_cov119-Cylindrotheca_fusiformis.AAC.20